MEILTILNEWWDNSKISKDKAKDYKRKIFDEIGMFKSYKLLGDFDFFLRVLF